MAQNVSTSRHFLSDRKTFQYGLYIFILYPLPECEEEKKTIMAKAICEDGIKGAYSETDKNNENLSVKKDLENITSIIKI